MHQTHLVNGSAPDGRFTRRSLPGCNDRHPREVIPGRKKTPASQSFFKAYRTSKAFCPQLHSMTSWLKTKIPHGIKKDRGKEDLTSTADLHIIYKT